MKFERESAIDQLVNDDINMIIDFRNQYGDEEYVASVLKYGFKGYMTFTDEELMVELNQREFA